ncbi:drug/metabolite transporter (DMT)-like permease [Anaerosolibacter carboniphilus]|uniref:Drug/metabolite transporter (DMT)-like permease n=1 Tax=Anaerosolibacter carboniphilus TaxID=1417629 RepID=A0A841KZH8_9FIRM|nr:DMT family transporter [Anaerosolibacter carboniphilus]MBB6217728.1 drug/metabolite transporter (DMT)-like permease [Anaerosolibacter carboniphilus]
MGKDQHRIHMLMVLCTVFWAGAFIAGKIGIREFPPFSLAFFRFLFATMVIFVVMIKYEEKSWRLQKEDWPYMLALGLIGMFGYHVLFFIALKYTSAMNSSMIGATNPLITGILAAIFLKEHLSLKRFGAILLAFSGIALTVSNGDITVFTSLSFNIGDLLMLLAVLCWAVYSIISRKITDRYSPLILTSYSFLVCLILLIPFVLWEKPLEYLPKVTWMGWTSVLYMAIFASVIGYLVQQISIKTIGASKTAAFINLVPVFSIILSALILHEEITSIKLLSAVIIITGVYLNTKLKSIGADVLSNSK